MAKIKLTYFVVIISLMLITEISYSQGTDSRTLLARQKIFYLAVNLNPMQTGISNNSSNIIEGVVINPKLSFGGSLEAGYFFAPFIGLSLGVGYGSWSQELNLLHYETIFPTQDTEDESFEMRITGSSIHEIQKYEVLSIPVNLIVRIQVTEKLGLFTQAGISVGMPIRSIYNSSGMFSYSGYYAAYPVLLEDIPEYGFPTDYTTSVSEPIITKALWSTINISSGFARSLGDNLQVGLQVNYSNSIGNVSENPAVQGVRISSQVNDLRSLAEASTVSKAIGYGLTLSVRYYLK